MEIAIVIHAALRDLRLGQRLAGRSTLKMKRKWLVQTLRNHVPNLALFHVQVQNVVFLL